jgi:hypothetical protein
MDKKIDIDVGKTYSINMDKMDRKLDMEMAKKADTRTGKTVM